jgi:hypothetical protein
MLAAPVELGGWVMSHVGVSSRFSRLAAYALAGVAGDLLVRGAQAAAPAGRRLLVTSVAGGIRLGRWLGEATEEARLKLADVTAEAYRELGEEVAPSAGPQPGRTGPAAPTPRSRPRRGSGHDEHAD